MSKQVKTNAMRMLDKAKIEYTPIFYTVDDNDLSGVTIAHKAGLPCDMVFKTLVAKGDKTGPIVMCIPVDKEIDLKKAATETGNKSIEMIHVKDLLSLTGYIRGGCSPIGMKKKFTTFFNDSVMQHEKITISAGIKGCQLLVNANELTKFVDAKICGIIQTGV